jgi:phospholipase/carboxylesterase
MSDVGALQGPRALPLSGSTPGSMVIFLHGYGSNGADLMGLVPYWRSAVPDTVFLAPNAPQPCPGAPDGYQWWSLTSLDPQARAMGLRQAAPIVDAYIDAELARYGLTEERLALVGFSQGTMMALHVGPRRERALAGILGYSGMLADAEALAAEVQSKPPVLLVHGDADTMVPFASLQRAQATLSGLDFTVDAHVSPGLGHSIDQAGLEVGGAFLQRVLAASA